jgi:hypothetical protein
MMNMGERFVLQYQGKRYSVERGQPAGTAAQGGGAPSGPDRWYLTLGGTAITSLEHQPDETHALLRARIRRWLAEHPELQTRDQLHLGGG